MPTETKTEKAVITKASAKVTAQVRAMIDAGTKFEGATLTTIRVLQSERKRLGYDAAQTRELLFLSYMEIKGAKTDEDKKSVRETMRFEVSRLMGRAFPKPEVAAEVEKAIANDEKLNGQKHGRIGINRLDQIVRGNMTFADALAGKKVEKKNSTQSTPKVLDLSETALENDLAGIRSKYCKATSEHAAAFTPKALRAMAAKVFCDGAYAPAKADEKAS